MNDIRRPLGVTWIGYFYILGVVVLLATLGVPQTPPINVRFGVPELPERVVRLVIAAFSFVMAIGYLKLKRWGLWTMVIYSGLFLVISLYQMGQGTSQPYLGNALFSVIVLSYSYKARKAF